ncbi:MAG TPA: rhamnulokinase family protein [Microlunatus sp.]|nr:rhamnulokinase family protein [Microlunatus sp.]
MTGPRTFAAIDIGASSGRVVAGLVSENAITIEVVHRFANGMHAHDGHLRWNLSGLHAEVLVGLSVLADRYDDVVSIGIDTWAVDYGLLDADGRLLAEPIAYRDDRTDAVINEVDASISRERQYAISGLQFLPFNTIYQLAAEQRSDQWTRAVHALLLPDLLGYWLTGELRTEITNASTTGLLDARRRSWSAEAFTALGIPADLLPPLIEPGETVGVISTEVADRTGLPRTTSVVAVGSHDTASAVVAVPAADRDIAYVSSGTWSLVGLELDEPVITDASRAANFTNEGGVDGRVRFLRNVGGLWLLQECLRDWSGAGLESDLGVLLQSASRLPTGGPVVDVDDEAFIAPDGMPARIRAACRAAGQPVPDGQAAVVRCVLDSLAVAYARTVEQAEQLTGRRAQTIHIVGGGSQNALLCQLTADCAARPVLAGPTEATALGNVVVQARTAGALAGTLEDLRAILRTGLELRRYEPTA